MLALDTLLPAVSRSSNLALDIFQIAAEAPQYADELIKAAHGINNFSSTLKQIGTIIKEDDRLPSHEAIETLEDVIEQSLTISIELENALSIQNNSVTVHGGNISLHRRNSLPRVEYLSAHLEALRMTLAVLVQTLHTAQSVMWSKLRPAVSPQQVITAVNSEHIQLEALIIQQQMATLNSATVHEHATHNSTRLLMEADSSQSLVAPQEEGSTKPADLYRYLNRRVSGLDASTSNYSILLQTIRDISASHSQTLVERWTSLPAFEANLQDTENAIRQQQRESQQPSVESDDEDENVRRRSAGTGSRRRSRGTVHIQPLFMDTDRDSSFPHGKYGPPAALSLDASPQRSHDGFCNPTPSQRSSTFSRSPTVSLPTEAAAAVEAKEEDDDIDLEIPWRIFTNNFYWEYVDDKVVKTNTDQKPSLAFLERTSQTEIMASWVCEDALREAGHKHTQVQKAIQDGRRTRYETLFCIECPLRFEQVKHLVERTVEIYRENIPPTPPPRSKDTIAQKPAPSVSVSGPRDSNRNRTPVPRYAYPPLERSMSSTATSAPRAPLLERTPSLPGASMASSFRSDKMGMPPRHSNLKLSAPPSAGYPPTPRAAPTTSQADSYPPRSTPAQAPPPTGPKSSHQSYPRQPQQAQLPSRRPVEPRTARKHQARNKAQDASSTRTQDRLSTRDRHKDAAISDSEPSDRERRGYGSRSRRHSSTKEKRSSGASTALGALVGVGGLTALLDGLSGL